MFDWFAAQPPRPNEPVRDRPSIPLTDEEREAFNQLCRQVGRRRAARATPGWWGSGWARLALGVVLVAVGSVWCIAWLRASVVASFTGVVVQALGFALVFSSEPVRLRPDGSGAPLEASLPQPGAPRRQGR